MRQVMEDLPTAPSAPARWTSADWLLLGLLVFMAAGIRVWQLAHTEVAARDSIGFIRIAWQLHQHPAYPLTILAVAAPLRAFDLPEADHMQRSAQFASALAAVLLVLPMFCLG